MTEDTLRLGLVGFGKIARDQHLPAVERMPGAEILAYADPVTQFAGLPGYPAIEAMLAAHSEIGAVALCVPPQVRFQAARAAIESGRHVFLEKPPGATLSEVESLVRLSASRGVTLFAAWHSRAAAGVGPARDWLRGRTIRSVHICWKEDVRIWHPGQKWIWEAGGFGIFDPAINAFSILTEIIAEPIRMTSADLAIPANCAAPIAAELAMESASGAIVTADLDFRQTGPQSWDIRVETDGESLLLHDGGHRLSIGGVVQHVESEGEYPALYRQFARLVRDGASHVDVAPLRLVADAFLVGKHRLVEPFED